MFCGYDKFSNILSPFLQSFTLHRIKCEERRLFRKKCKNGWKPFSFISYTVRAHQIHTEEFIDRTKLICGSSGGQKKPAAIQAFSIIFLLFTWTFSTLPKINHSNIDHKKDSNVSQQLQLSYSSWSALQ